MNKLFLMVLVSVFLILIQSNLASKSKEKNPFSIYFTKIERNEKKIKKMDSSKDKSKIEKCKATIARDKEKLQKAVDNRREEVEKTIKRYEVRLAKDREAGRDTTITQKKLYELNNELIKIDAWEKNEDPPEFEKFNPEVAKPEPEKTIKEKEPAKKEASKSNKNEFDPIAFRKRMEKEH